METFTLTNHLAHEKSPYLLQHAENPVDWRPWNEEAFAQARAENKPIFLSIGYSTCHWCHVMAHESFEDEATAAIMNREFVNIKVDREERPDVDRVYMTFVQATTGHGGWPMSVWLTPDLKPFVGGTYFPPEERYGQPGFKKVLERIATAWKQDREKIVEQGSRIVEALTASTAQARAKIAETRLQIIQLDQDLKTEVMKDLRDTQAKVAELSERRVGAEDQLKRVDIRSPQSGIVHQLSVHTIGGVVTQSEPIMLIVPEGEALVIEAKIAPQDIDHVQMGQAAFVRFTAFSQRTTPEFNGSVVRLAADLTKEQQTGQAYFIARIGLPESEVKRLGKLKLVPGMPAEVYIRTTERTALSYLIKPLRDQITRAFTEH